MQNLLFQLTCLVIVWVQIATAQEHEHGDQAANAPRLEPPTVFLDKSPKIVEYQLKRLDNQRLLMVERKTDDKKYIPVYSAILSRVGMSPQFLEEATEALVKLNDSNPVDVLLAAITKFDISNQDERRAARQLANMLLRQKRELLEAELDSFKAAADSDNSLVRSIAAAALVTSGHSDLAIANLENSAAKLAFLKSIELIPGQERRSKLRDQVVELLADDATDIKQAATLALSFIADKQESTFELIAPLVADNQLRDAAVTTLLKVPADQRAADSSLHVVSLLVEHAETTPAKDRTTGPFIDAMQLADQLMASVPAAEAKSYRDRLDAVVVRVVRIKSVEEEMRYDIPYFAVQTGKSVQVVFENHDLMPHNLVFTTPGALKEVAQLGLEAGPNGGFEGKQYVPASDKVLFATQMVAANQQEALTFTAPTEPGEYPYVCTFPQHWYRMYGVMVVVEDLDAWLKNPIVPANPIGSNRSFVQAWTVDDLKDELDAGLRGRTAEIGMKIFAEASCAGCHKMKGEGGVIGPELTDVLNRWKGDRVGVLREILDPSHKVDAKYAMQRILTVDGRTITGVLIAEDDDKVTLITNAEAKEPTIIAQDDIDAMVPSSVSMMPKALLDQYTKDEIFELMAYLESVNPEAK
jgi:putative heme-binding domain-containing protein